MEQNTKLKTKEEEISSLTTVIQKWESLLRLNRRLLAENRSLKNQLFLIDRQNLSSMFDS